MINIERFGPQVGRHAGRPVGAVAAEDGAELLAAFGEQLRDETSKLAAAGMALGLLASWLLGRTLQGLLFGVTPSDPMTFAGALVLLMGVAALAGYLPARLASRLDPVEALRAE